MKPSERTETGLETDDELSLPGYESPEPYGPAVREHRDRSQWALQSL